ncbi:hypothetical protein CB1_000334014 [Camelus ferus]|nr:hypothetical protein CB1_000334014 [Camelus ferus]
MSRGTEAQDLNVIEEVIRMMLEIINSCLTNSLHHNPNLVYALLYKRDLFEQFRTHPSFQDIMQNIDLVITFFSSRLLQAGAELSVERVLEIIKQGVVALPKDRLKHSAPAMADCGQVSRWTIFVHVCARVRAAPASFLLPFQPSCVLSVSPNTDFSSDPSALLIHCTALDQSIRVTYSYPVQRMQMAKESDSPNPEGLGETLVSLTEIEKGIPTERRSHTSAPSTGPLLESCVACDGLALPAPGRDPCQQKPRGSGSCPLQSMKIHSFLGF